MQFAEAFGKKFAENKSLIRIRTFEMGNHTFKVKVPLTSEYEAMIERLKVPDAAKVAEYYDALTKEFKSRQSELTEDLGIVFKDDDVTIQGRSMKEAAQNKALTEMRVTEMFKLLVPEEEGFDMETITYDMIEELFPFSIQIELIENISETISPSYKETKGK